MASADDLDLAITASSLGSLPKETIGGLMDGARRVRIPARSTIHHEGEEAPHLELVISGLVRVQVSAPDGRMMTIRYCRAGALLGAATLYAAVARPFSVQAVSDSVILSLRPAVVRARADRDPDVALALLHETSERVMSFVSEFSGQAFASVRERIARHLLDLAMDHANDRELVAPISQQELAEAVGTVREVVVRVLRDLRARDAVETRREGIVLRDPELLARLQAESWSKGS